MTARNMERLELSYDSYPLDGLPQRFQRLIDVAYEATSKAYAPYSGFKVAALAELFDGEVITATNQESISFPVGICAERSLLFSYFNSGKDCKINTIVVVAKSEGDRADVSPCGICRQSLLDAEIRQGSDIAIIFSTNGRYIVLPTVKMLLPFSFDNF